ncbi:hypothetical protein KDU71_15675 [Carboxylicivirga sediminis]|uniref:Uncharacterized protein n=1 Tax=Carboxylicivirga sediminis TaxID=2006564 RepID=A0A941F558_9BACT|nr:hypothetical protein [Carboxylicivirga sediminis]MBR8537011.1 hypothetical protein [Carboxylicivirga sediminis]
MANDNKIKHLEFIQGIINRHNSNSFLIKGWTITISAALYALSGTIKETYLVLLALVPILMFWGLDAFYLSNERCFVDLYSSVSKGAFQLPTGKTLKEKFNANSSNVQNGVIDEFDMNFKKFKIWKDNTWVNVLFSKTILSFYITLLAITIIISVVFNHFNQNKSEIIKVETTINPKEFDVNLNAEPPTIINNIYPSKNSTDSLTRSK